MEAAIPEDEPDQVDDGAEVIALNIELDLVPEWSNVVERMARHHGERVAIGIQEGSLVIKVAVLPERKEGLIADMKSHWDVFVEARKREGRWRS